MASDLEQIKALLWAILGLQVFFIASNILCRVFGCGDRKKGQYNDLWQRRKIDKILSITEQRLATHPNDVDSLYFRAKALIASGLSESARSTIKQLMAAEPSLASVCQDWLAAMDKSHSGDS